MYLIFLFVYAILIATRQTLTELVYFLPLLGILILLLKPKRYIFKHLGFLLGFEGCLFLLALFIPGKAFITTPLGNITYEGMHRFIFLVGKAFLPASAVINLIHGQ